MAGRARVRVRGRTALTMSPSPLAVVVLAAGQGTRMKSALPKVLHKIAGRPMLGHVLAVARALGAERMVVVTAPGAEPVAALAKEWGADDRGPGPPARHRSCGARCPRGARRLLGQCARALRRCAAAFRRDPRPPGRGGLTGRRHRHARFSGRRSHRLRPDDHGRRCACPHRRAEGRDARRTQDHAAFLPECWRARRPQCSSF